MMTCQMRQNCRPEVTSAMQTYIDPHPHAAVRTALTGQPGITLRLMVAHAIAGSPLWSVKSEPQRAGNEWEKVAPLFAP